MLALGRDGGTVVNILAFYTDDPSSNPADFSVLYLEKPTINEKRGWDWVIQKNARY